MFLLGRNEEINKWLDEHPAVLGGGALLLGLVLLGFGAKALLTGRSSDKYGNQMEGGMAYLHGAIMAGVGGIIIVFGLYKLVSAMF